MQNIQDASVSSGKRALVRCDLDVPLNNGKILEQYRLDSALETLKYLIKKGAKPIIAGHVGKPEGKIVDSLSTKNLLPYFEQNLGKGNFELLENLRFDPREEANDDSFAKELAAKADVYVNESFATCHRKHASIVGVPKYLPHYAGFRLQKEVETLSHLIKNPQRPLMVLIGGAKLESKKPVVSKFLKIADKVLLGGKLAGAWDEVIPDNLILPRIINKEEKDLDPETIKYFISILNEAKTILWVGPVGVYEEEEFMAGTKAISKSIAQLTGTKNITSVIGGGDTIASVDRLGLLAKFTFVSTGGSAMLDFLVNETLPGIEALN